MKFFNSDIKYLLIFLGLYIFPNYAQPQSYLVHTYTENNGLPSSTVHDITQDNTGRIWFATRSGIAVYDGSRWETYTVADGLSAPEYFKIKADKQGTIWATTRDSISFYNGEIWSSLPRSGDLNKLEGDITAFELASINHQTALVIGTSKSGVFIRLNNQWKHITQEDGLLSVAVNAIAVWHGQLYVATDAGLSVLKENKVDNSLNGFINSPSHKIIGIAVENKENDLPSSNEDIVIWLLGENWIGYLEKEKFKLLSNDAKLSFIRNFVVVLQPDNREGLYYGNLFNIFHINKKNGQIKSLGEKNGIHNEGASSMLIDRENNLWIANIRGVSKVSGMRFANYRKEHGLLEDEVTAVWETETGKIVFGHNKGLTFYDGNNFRKMTLSQKKYLSEAETRVLDISGDSQGNIWVAASYLGVAKVNRKGDITWYNKYNGLPGNISSVLADNTGKIWAGGIGGVYVLKDKKFIPEKTGEFPTPIVRRIFQGIDGSIYLVTRYLGVYVYHNNKWKQYASSQGETSNNIFAVLPDSRGRVWAGGLAGLFVLDNKGLEKFDANGFQISRPVYFIIEDDKKRIWFGTDNGVIRWDTQEVKKYTIHQGLAGQETNRAAGFVDRRGRVWIGTDRGVSRYQEEFDELNIPPPLVELLYLEEVSGKKLSLQKANKLNHDKNNLVFHFRGISFIDENALYFKSKLEGFDQDWSGEYQSYNQQIRYTNLPPGQYRFHLKAKNAMDVWSESVTSSMIIIQNPFWKEWWFFLFSFSCVIIGMLFLHHLRVKYKIRRSLEIEKVKAKERERVRKEIALDLHDGSGYKLTKISRFVDISKSEGAKKNSNIIGYLNKIRNLSDSLHTDISDFAWVLNPDRDSLYEVVIRLKNFGDEIFDKTEVAFQVKGISKELMIIILPMHWKQHLIFIFKEGMHNILKHAECHNAVLEVITNDGNIEMALWDDGKGFNKETCSLGNGLINMEDRVKEIDSVVQVVSHPGKGTRIQIIGDLNGMGTY